MRYNKVRDSHERYKVDLKNFMACCESNYRRLYQVFPNVETDLTRRLGLSQSSERDILLTVIERTPYTTLLSIREQQRPNDRLSPNKPAPNSPGLNAELQNKIGWREPPVLNVRMYHDARLAEVISCDGLRSAIPKNSYPNKNMLQRDEKAQWNRFLEEWLMVCIARGYVTDSVTDPAPVLFDGDN